MSLRDYMFWKMQQPQAAAKEWYDRAPKHRVLYYDGYGIAPHASTLRATYVCPDHRKAFIQLCMLHTKRASAATTVGGVILDVNTRIEGFEYLLDRVFHLNNTVNYVETRTQPLQVLLLPRNEIWFLTLDSSVGGTNDFIMTLVYTEFDY